MCFQLGLQSTREGCSRYVEDTKVVRMTPLETERPLICLPLNA